MSGTPLVRSWFITFAVAAACSNADPAPAAATAPSCDAIDRRHRIYARSPGDASARRQAFLSTCAAWSGELRLCAFGASTTGDARTCAEASRYAEPDRVDDRTAANTTAWLAALARTFDERERVTEARAACARELSPPACRIVATYEARTDMPAWHRRMHQAIRKLEHACAGGNARACRGLGPTYAYAAELLREHLAADAPLRDREPIERYRRKACDLGFDGDDGCARWGYRTRT